MNKYDFHIIARHDRDTEDHNLSEEEITSLMFEEDIPLLDMIDCGVYYFAMMDGWTYRIERR